MKKLLIALVSCALLAGMILPLCVSAENLNDESDGIDKNLVVHYDFNGDTLEEQLSDKAPAGVSKEDLTLISTNDEATGTPLSYVSDGIAHIDHSINNYMQVMFNADNNVGTDVLDCAQDGEMTVFIALSVSGSPQAWATALDFNNVVRLIMMGSPGNTAIFSTMCIRGTTTMNTGAQVDFSMKNADIYHDIDTVYIAVTYQYDKDAKKLFGAVYLSFDYGETYTETLALFENVEEFIPQSAHICFGKTRAGNQFKRTDHGSSYDFYDFRVYNKALSLDEVRTINTGHTTAEEPDTDDTDEIDTSADSTAGDESTAESTGKSEKTTTDTVAMPGETKPSESQGCGSFAMGEAIVISMVALTGVCFKRKKK